MVRSLSLQTDDSDLAAENVYFLQRWFHKWDAYIDVTDLEEIQSEDRLTIIVKPSQSPVKVNVSTQCCQANTASYTFII